MIRTTPLVIVLAAAAMVGGCGNSGRGTETATATSATGVPSAATPASTPEPATGNAGAAADGDALLQDNDHAIAEDKRMIAMLGRYQSKDFGKYERLRKACETQAHGTLADSAAPVVARCIEAGW